MKRKLTKDVGAVVREQRSRPEELEYCPDCHSTFRRQTRCSCFEEDEDGSSSPIAA
jgi:hypothetical protein